MQDWLARRVARYDAFYASNRPGDLLIVNRPGWPKKKNLFDYDFERGGHLKMAADLITGAKQLHAMNGDLEDDLIPWMIADFGIAILHTFLADLPVTFAEWTSWADHPLAGPDGYARVEELQYDPTNRWVVRIKEMTAYWREHWDGSFLYLPVGHYGPLDLANALRGNTLFTDFFDYEDDVHALLDAATRAIIAFEEDIRSVGIPQLHAIGMPFWGALAPRGAVFLSEDAMDISGPAISEEWGLPYSTRIRDHFGCLAVHHHMYGAKVHGVIGQEAQHSLVQVSADPNCPPPITQVRELAAANGNNALMFDAGPDDILAHLDDLRDLRAIIICCNSDIEQGKRVVDAVREISNIQ